MKRYEWFEKNKVVAIGVSDPTKFFDKCYATGEWTSCLDCQVLDQNDFTFTAVLSREIVVDYLNGD